jgi:hypothetical protein
MNIDRNLEHVEELLAHACADISEAVALYSSLSASGQAKFKRNLADALVRVFEARDAVFALRPDLRPASFPASESNPG